MMKNTICLVLIIIFISFCGTKQREVEKIIEDGVEVVINQLDLSKTQEKANDILLSEEFIIDFERENLIDLGIREIIGLDVDSGGKIYLMIKSSSHNFILKFDERGKFLFAFGRKGQGPGELVAPRFLKVNKQEQVLISDNVRKKIFIYKKNGDFLKEITLEPNFGISTPLDNGNILAVQSIFNKEEGRLEFPIVLCNSELEKINVLHPGKHMPILLQSKRANGLNLYADNNVFKISDKYIYIGNYGEGYEFLVYNLEGQLLRKIRKNYREVKVPGEVKEKTISWIRESDPSFEQALERIFFPEFYPPFQYFFLDEKGRLFVMTYERGEGENDFMYDIFDSDGIFIGRIELDNFGYSPFVFTGIPTPLNVVAKNDRIYSLRDKENGFKELVVYKMN